MPGRSSIPNYAVLITVTILCCFHFQSALSCSSARLDKKVKRPYHTWKMTKRGQCVDGGSFVHELCRDFNVNNMTYDTNIFRHPSVQDAYVELKNTMWGFVKVECSPDSKRFFCSAFLPQCSKSKSKSKKPRMLLPCRSLCEVVREGCVPILEKYTGYPWPPALRCELFPVNGGDEGDCLPPSPEALGSIEVKHVLGNNDVYLSIPKTEGGEEENDDDDNKNENITSPTMTRSSVDDMKTSTPANIDIDIDTDGERRQSQLELELNREQEQHTQTVIKHVRIRNDVFIFLGPSEEEDTKTKKEKEETEEEGMTEEPTLAAVVGSRGSHGQDAMCSNYCAERLDPNETLEVDTKLATLLCGRGHHQCSQAPVRSYLNSALYCCYRQSETIAHTVTVDSDTGQLISSCACLNRTPHLEAA